MSTFALWLISVTVIFGVLISLGYYLDHRAWNRGVCRENGEPWTLFGRDRQGGRGYMAGDERVWISWPVDRGYRNEG